MEDQDKNIKICYFQAHTNDGVGYVCVALQRPPREAKDDDRVYTAGFSFCSPKDSKHFSKSKARTIALSRLKGNSKSTIELRPEVPEDTLKLNDIFNDVLLLATTTRVEKQTKEGKGQFTIAPNWLVRAWDAERVDFGLRQD